MCVGLGRGGGCHDALVVLVVESGQILVILYTQATRVLPPVHHGEGSDDEAPHVVGQRLSWVGPDVVHGEPVVSMGPLEVVQAGVDDVVHVVGGEGRLLHGQDGVENGDEDDEREQLGHAETLAEVVLVLLELVVWGWGREGRGEVQP